MKSRKSAIMQALLLLSMIFCMPIYGQDLIGIPESCDDGADQIKTPDGRIFSCSLESGEFEDFTPPTDDAIWPISIGSANSPPSVAEQRPGHWNFRALLIIGPSGSPRTIEFDTHANIVSIDGSKPPAPSHLSELYFHGAKLWPHAAVFYQISDPDGLPDFFPDMGAYSIFRNEVADSGFIVEGENICPAAVDGGILWYLVYNPNEIALIGSCARAAKRPLDSERAGLYYYPGFDSTIPANRQMHWTFQRHSDPVTPLSDDNGNCHLYCKD